MVHSAQERVIPSAAEAAGGGDPFRIEGPCLWSFSGGRTSAYMLWRALQAYGGKLPDDHVVAFANTGKEREETLRFVYECGSRWNVPIAWVEFLKRSGDPAVRYERVSFNSASRNGEPFARLIAAKSFVPNSMMRFCTEEMKVNTIRHFIQSELGWPAWSNAVGLRHDEGHRVMKALARNHEGKSPWTTKVPLANARVTRRDVDAFWSEQPFDLGLRSYEGNCDLCFLKGRATLKALIRENPGAADWWIGQEAASKGAFRSEYSFEDLVREVEEQPHLFDEPHADEQDAECGSWCGEAA
jgi:3'-phosphoadenosine 5'-phosphosulfate sulfotransferase (PAPS reductase)/FAD synthetase